MLAHVPTASFEHFGRPELRNHPVIGVSWFEAQEYCQWPAAVCRRRPNGKRRRGEDGRLYPWGDDAPSANRANFDQAYDETMPVGSFPDGRATVRSTWQCLGMGGRHVTVLLFRLRRKPARAACFGQLSCDPRRGVHTAARALRSANRFWAFLDGTILTGSAARKRVVTAADISTGPGQPTFVSGWARGAPSLALSQRLGHCHSRKGGNPAHGPKTGPPLPLRDAKRYSRG
jgi:hypothetical protein